MSDPDRLMNRVKVLEAEISDLRRQLQDAAKRIREAELQRHLAEKWGKDLHECLAGVYASTSWRITSPLRALKNRRIEFGTLSAVSPLRIKEVVGRTLRRLFPPGPLRAAIVRALARFPSLDGRIRSWLSSGSSTFPHSDRGPAGTRRHLQTLPDAASRARDDIQRALDKRRRT